MENPITQLEQLTLNQQSRMFLKETAKWASFLSIIGFIGIGLMILLGLFAGTLFSNLPQAQEIPFDFGMTMTITYLILALVYFFPIMYLYKFSQRMKMALSTKDDENLAAAFESLKSHYKFIGVFTIIMLSLYVLLIVVSLLGVAMNA